MVEEIDDQVIQESDNTLSTGEERVRVQIPAPYVPPPQQQYQAPPPPRARAAAPPPSSDVAVARVIPGATPAQWACPHCTFANLLHRTQTTAAGLSICELCTRTARVQ